MRSVWKMTIALAVLALALVCTFSLVDTRPAERLVVRGFTTNRYTFFPGDYVCAIIELTNASDHELFIFHTDESRHQGDFQTPQPYYALREGGFPSVSVRAHSGFRFETAVLREHTNQITLDGMRMRWTPWPLCNLPPNVEQKLPGFLQRPSLEPFKLTTPPFMVSNPPTGD